MRCFLYHHSTEAIIQAPQVFCISGILATISGGMGAESSLHCNVTQCRCILNLKESFFFLNNVVLKYFTVRDLSNFFFFFLFSSRKSNKTKNQMEETN